MALNRSELSIVWKIAFTYVGAVIGAGFASGQEINQFFVQYGKNGFLGMLFAGVLFMVGGVIFLRIAEHFQVTNYYQIFYELIGKRWGIGVDVIYTLFTLGSISVMLAGSGGVFQETLGIRYSVGVLITLGVMLLTVAAGIEGVLWLNTFLIPFLIGVIIFTCVSQFGGGVQETITQLVHVGKMPWFISGAAYVAFNMFLSLAVLTKIGAEVRSKRTLVAGGVLGGFLLALLLLAMGCTLFAHNADIQLVEMPMLTIANRGGELLHFLYMIVLWIALITTAVANAYAFIQRVKPLFKLSTYNAMMLTVLVVLPLTRLGFGKLIGLLYPIYGAVALVVLVVLGIRVGLRRG